MRRLVVLAFVLSLILALTGPAFTAFATGGGEAPTEAGAAEPAEPKVLRIRIGQTYPNLLPQAAASSGLALLYDLLYSRLLQPNPNGFFEAELAERWEMEEDASAYTFWIRRDARWHDGTPVTARDVKFTYTAYLDPDSGGRKVGAYSIIKGAKAYSAGEADEVAGLRLIDDYTIRIEMEEPSAIFLQTCCSLRNPILPAHIYQDVPAAELPNHPTFTGAQPPVGSGPFRFVEHVPDQFMVLDANDDYYFGRPKIDRVQILMMSSHDSALIAAQRGELDLLYHSSGVDLYQSFIDDPEWTVKASQGSVTTGVMFNLRKPYLQDKRVRQAFQHAVNREQLIEVFRGGNGTIYNTPLAHSWYQKPEWANRYPYDPDRARQLLRQAGWDSSRVLRFTTGPFRNETARSEAAAIQQFLADAGINIEWVEVQSFNAWDIDWDIHRGGWSIFADPDGFLSYRFLPAGTGEQEDETTYGLKHPELIELILAGKSELDRDRRAVIYQQINDQLIEDLPFASWYMTHSWYPMHKRVSIPHFDQFPDPTGLDDVPVAPAFTHRLNVYKFRIEQWDINR